MSPVTPPTAPVNASKTDFIVQCIGWSGAVCMLLAYFLTSVAKFPVDGPVSLTLNIYAGTTIAMASWRRRAYQSVFVNTIWTGIGLVTLAGVLI